MIGSANNDFVLGRNLFHHLDHFRQDFPYLEKWCVAFFKSAARLKISQLAVRQEVIFERSKKPQIILDELFEVRHLVSKHSGEKRTSHNKLLSTKGLDGVSVGRSNQPGIVEKFFFLQFESILRTNRFFSHLKEVVHAREASDGRVKCSLERIYISFPGVTHCLSVPVRGLTIRRPHLHDGNNTCTQSENAAHKPLEIVEPASNRRLTRSGNDSRQELRRSGYHRWFAGYGEVYQPGNDTNRNSYDETGLDSSAMTLLCQLKPLSVVSVKQPSAIEKSWHFLASLRSTRRG